MEVMQNIDDSVLSMGVVEDIFDQVDQNKNQHIDYREFIASQARPLVQGELKKSNYSLVLQAFNFFDTDCDGMITCEDLHKILHQENPDVACDVIEKMIAEADSDNDGKVSLQEFLDIMQVQPEEEKKEPDRSLKNQQRSDTTMRTEGITINNQQSDETALASRLFQQQSDETVAQRAFNHIDTTPPPKLTGQLFTQTEGQP